MFFIQHRFGVGMICVVVLSNTKDEILKKMKFKKRQ